MAPLAPEEARAGAAAAPRRVAEVVAPVAMGRGCKHR